MLAALVRAGVSCFCDNGERVFRHSFTGSEYLVNFKSSDEIYLVTRDDSKLYARVAELVDLPAQAGALVG